MKRHCPPGAVPASRNNQCTAPAEPSDNQQRRPAHFGFLEWFHIGEYDRVEQAILGLKALGVRHLRTGISWADWHQPGGEEWYSWLLPRLSQDLEILPCVLYTPPSFGLKPKTSSPPRNPRSYADFIDLLITRFGSGFEYIELWNEPNNGCEWDWTLDPSWTIFAEMVGGAAYWARQRGKKAVLGGMSPVDPNWLDYMGERGVLEFIDAVGIHGFPDTFDFSWPGWAANVQRVREVLAVRGYNPEIWITETGFSTWRHDEHRQLREFLNVLDAPVDRVYWYALQDLHPEKPTLEGFQSDIREYHFGIKSAEGFPKLLYRLWDEGGIEKIRQIANLHYLPPHQVDTRPVLITGGAGFIGTNVASHLLSSGRQVQIYDNLSRPGVEKNLQWLLENYNGDVGVDISDIRDEHALRESVAGASQVFHFAAQVAVTTSLVDPRFDFEVNAGGALNILEAIRRCDDPPPLVFTSTNKVYGALEQLDLRIRDKRYEPCNQVIRDYGLSEESPLDFHSPYGCSKGAADQYILDYSRSYGLPAVVFRMSCIYGPHQFGTEDQGWVAHFLIRALEGKPITLYGDGMQVRDVLFVEDLVQAFMLAQENMPKIAGTAFNIGGGPHNAVSLLELVEIIERLSEEKVDVLHSQWRTGDQRYYVSDTARFREATGWKPEVDVEEGVSGLHRWLVENRGLSRTARAAARR